MRKHLWTSIVLAATLAVHGCGSETRPTTTSEGSAAASFAFGEVEVETVGTAADGLARPRDLAFNPDGGGELWVVNQAAPYRPADEAPWVAPPEGAECLDGYGRDTTDPSFWSSTTTFYDVGTEAQRSEHIIDAWSAHFLAEASSIAFGARHRPHPLGGPSEPGDPGPRTFATCGESRNEFKGCRPQNDFMGPALWTTDPETYGKTNPYAVEALAKLHCKDAPDPDLCKARADLGSHLDMLHESPNCMGVAWESGTAYWVFDGCGGSQWVPPAGRIGRVGPHDPGTFAPGSDAIADCKDLGDIVRYDFQTDHGRGFDNHCDGVIERYAVGVVKRVPGVPSHLEYDSETQGLYIADSGHGRVLVLDTRTGRDRVEIEIPPRENEGDACTAHWRMREDAEIRILTERADFVPSGIALHGRDLLFVSDNASGEVLALSRESGEILDAVDLGMEPGALMGIAVAPEGDFLYAVDSVGDRVVRVGLPRL